ncbi:MAG: hypothetical protein KC668_19970 [Myxococcales bacterium]|nr:hypothetical protein [Myxococcales bacterium]
MVRPTRARALATARILGAQVCLALLAWVLLRRSQPEEGLPEGALASSTPDPEDASPGSARDLDLDLHGRNDELTATDHGAARGASRPPGASTQVRELSTSLPPSEALRALTECEAACDTPFQPQPSALPPDARRRRAGLHRIPGGRTWWLDPRAGTDQGALVCSEVGDREVECPWTLPLEARIPRTDPGTRATPYHATLFIAEALLEVQLFVPGEDGPRCTCPPFDLRGVPD